MRIGKSPDEPEFVSPMQAYQLLANAIIIRAALDLRNLLSGRGYYDPVRERKIKELDAFFHSDFYDILTDVPASAILDPIYKEATSGKAGN